MSRHARAADLPTFTEKTAMDEVDSSPPLPGPNPSTTSSTTGPADDLLRYRDTDAILTPEQQETVLEAAERGQGAGITCRQLGLPSQVFWNTLAADLQFRIRYQTVHDTLNLNVHSKAYHSAMGGSVSMQQFLLRQQPPFFFNRPGQAQPPTRLEHASDEALLEFDRTASADRQAVRTLCVEVLRIAEPSGDLPPSDPPA